MQCLPTACCVYALTKATKKAVVRDQRLIAVSACALDASSVSVGQTGIASVIRIVRPPEIASLPPSHDFNLGLGKVCRIGSAPEEKQGNSKRSSDDGQNLTSHDQAP
jgi:hypothetical protein